MFTALASRMRGTAIRIKSVFTNSSKGLLYIEALAEPYARDAILGENKLKLTAQCSAAPEVDY